MDVNVIIDRGSNFIKALAQYEPVYCFGHRLNNVLKIGFFQQQEKKAKHIQLTTSDICADPELILRNTDLLVQNDCLTSSSDSTSSDSEQEAEEKQQQGKLNKSLLLVKPRFKTTSATTVNAQKLLVENAPPEAKQVLLALKHAKRLVKYVKLVSI